MDILAHFSTGRILLHAICASRNRKWAWHAAGIARELRYQLDPGRTLRERINVRHTLRAAMLVGLALAIF